MWVTCSWVEHVIISSWQAERARNDLERELEDLQDALDEQGGATQAQVL